MNIRKLKYKISFIDLVQWLVLVGLILGRYAEVLAVVVTTFIILINQKYAYRFTKLILLLTALLIYSSFLIFFNNYGYSKFFQQYIVISICALCYFQFFQFSKDNLLSLFEKYIQLMYLVCLLGLLQFIICLFFQVDIFPFQFLYTLDGGIFPLPEGRIMRIRSILMEAGNLGTCLVPVIAYILFDKNYFKENKRKAVIIITTYLLTLATISYVMLAILLFVKIYTKLKYIKYILSVLIIICIPYIISSMNSRLDESEITNSDFFSVMQQKIVQTLSIWDTSSPSDFELLNASSYAIATNLWVAMNSPGRVLGTGLGTHQENYTQAYPPNNYYLYGLNSDDAYSLLIRIFSEFGIFGIILYFFFLKRNFNSSNIVNYSIFFLLIAMLIRGGNYIFYGTVMFHYLYYYTSKKQYSRKNEQ
ncbi:MAG: hypothetical protein ACK5KT_08050 [Dysgonomonas sp.]